MGSGRGASATAFRGQEFSALSGQFEDQLLAHARLHAENSVDEFRREHLVGFSGGGQMALIQHQHLVETEGGAEIMQGNEHCVTLATQVRGEL